MPFLVHPSDPGSSTFRQDARVEAPSMPNDRFGHQHSEILSQRNQRINNLKAMSEGQEERAAKGVAHKMTHTVCQSGQQTFNLGPRIQPKSLQIQLWTPRSPVLCSRVSSHRSMVPKGAKLEAKALPNNIFRVPEGIGSNSQAHH